MISRVYTHFQGFAQPSVDCFLLLLLLLFWIRLRPVFLFSPLPGDFKHFYPSYLAIHLPMAKHYHTRGYFAWSVIFLVQTVRNLCGRIYYLLILRETQKSFYIQSLSKRIFQNLFNIMPTCWKLKKLFQFNCSI